MIDVDKAIASAVKTGKVVFGAREALWSARTGKARMIILAPNSPPQIREDLERYGAMSEIPVVTCKDSSIDLGMVCGRRFPVVALTIKELGDSDILDLAGSQQEVTQDAGETVEEP